MLVVFVLQWRLAATNLREASVQLDEPLLYLLKPAPLQIGSGQIFKNRLASKSQDLEPHSSPQPSTTSIRQSTASANTLIMAGHHNHRKLNWPLIDRILLTLIDSPRARPGVG